MTSLTKKAIKESFIKLINVKPLSAVTVQEISNDCGINRNTFYYHYDDIPSLIEEIIIDEFNEIALKHNSIDSIENAFFAVLDFAEQNKRAISHVYNSINRNIFENYLWKFSEEIVGKFIDNLLAERNVPESDKFLLIKFMNAVSIGLALDYMDSGFRNDARKDLKRICTLSAGTLESIISRCEGSFD